MSTLTDFATPPARPEDSLHHHHHHHHHLNHSIDPLDHKDVGDRGEGTNARNRNIDEGCGGSASSAATTTITTAASYTIATAEKKTSAVPSVTPHDISSSSFSSSFHDENKQVRFEGGASGENGAATDDASGRGGGGGVGNVLGLISMRGRYVSPGRRASMSPSPTNTLTTPPAIVPASTNSSNYNNDNNNNNNTANSSSSTSLALSSPACWQQHLEPSVTNSPTMEENHKSTSPDENSEAEAASALAGVAAAAAAAAAAATCENDNIYFTEPKSPLPSLPDGGLFNLSTPKNKECMMTPTDFSVDYGKPLFDTSNVLAWLQSPSGLFSPGGFGGSSFFQTPNKAATPGGAYRTTTISTPRTPLVSTSFFFSDVAKLPKSKNSTSNKSIICISPLATVNSRQFPSLLSPRCAVSSSGTESSGDAAVAAEGVRSGSTNASSFPLLSDTPLRGADDTLSNGCFDSGMGINADSSTNIKTASGGVDVHMAERDCMEDEDLTVLLQLAANSCPAGGVFRGKKDLGLPMIGGSDSSKKIFSKPSLEMRTTSTNPTTSTSNSSSDTNTSTSVSATAVKDIKEHQPDSTRQGSTDVPPTFTDTSAKSSSTKKLSESDSKSKANGNAPVSSAAAVPSFSMNVNSSNSNNGHHLGAPFGYPRDVYYPPHHGPLSHGIPPGAASGSMRVVVGAPPPQSSNAAAPNGGSSNGYADYGMPPPPPPGYPGMYAYPPPPHPGYYYSYPPPPPHPHLQQKQQPLPWGGGMKNNTSNSSSSKKKKRSAAASSSSTATTDLTSSGTTSSTPGSVYPTSILSGPTISSSATKSVASANSAGATGAANTPATKPKKRKPTSPSSSDGNSGDGSGTSGGPGNPPPKKKNRSPQLVDKAERAKAAQKILQVNAASGGKNDKAASLAAAILRGVTMRPSGKWQAQLYFAGKSRYIGVFDTREKAALAYEIAREKLKAGPKDHGNCPKSTENLVNLARKAAFDGVNEKLK